MDKTCNKCGLVKSLDNFTKCKSCANGVIYKSNLNKYNN